MRDAAPPGTFRSAAPSQRGCRLRRIASHRSRPVPHSLHSRVAVYRHTYTRPRYLTPFGGNVIAGLRRLAVVSTALLLLSACGGGSPSLNATSLLKTTKSVLDATQSFHFVLTGANVGGSSSGAQLTGGHGDMKRPDSMSGTLQVSISAWR